uniref:Angiopoietin-4-like n=1 Tax=Diabrotica virgifera virgifera TaxID=50390 RepID=A0A6P7F827_DIAVI
MISFVIILLICAKFGDSVCPPEKVSPTDAGANTWKNDLDLRLGAKKDNEKVPMKSSSVVDKPSCLQEYENTLKSIFDKLNSLQECENTLKHVSHQLNSLLEYENTNNVFDQCKYLIGKSQIPFCRLNPEQPFSEAEHAYPSSCKEILKSGKNKSDVYIIKPKTSTKPFAVLCDMETRGGGWTHIQKRFDGSQDFYLPWRDYKFGFGDLKGEFWIGLESIYHMTGNTILVFIIIALELLKRKVTVCRFFSMLNRTWVN